MDLEKFEHAITKYGTPLYVFDIDEVKRKTDYFRDRLGKAQDCVLQSKQILF